MNSNNKMLLLTLLIFASFPTIVNANEDEGTLNDTNYPDINASSSGSIDNEAEIKTTNDSISMNEIIEASSHSSTDNDVVYYDEKNLDDVILDAGLTYDKERVKARKDALINGKELPNYPNDYDKQIREKNNRKNEEAKKKAQEEYERQKREEEKRKQESKMDVTKPLVKSEYYPKVPIYDKVVDISVHQTPGAIDYDKLARSIDGAILRASIRNKDLVNRKDTAVERHYYELNKRGVPLGFYHYSRAITEEEAIAEANFVLNIVKNKKVSLPIYIDIEDHDRQLKSTKNQISKVADAFCKAIRRNGYVAGIYSYPWFADEYLTKEVRDNNEFWIAEWKKDQKYPNYNKSHYDSWQYSSKGGVAGYKYDIDKNVLYRDYPLIMTGKSYKGYDKVASEIISGKWGNGLERQKRLEYAGYNYNIIQEYVNKLLKSKTI